MTAKLIAFDTEKSCGGFLGTATIGFPDIGLLIGGIGIYEHTRNGQIERWCRWPSLVSWVDGKKVVMPMVETLDESAATEYELLVLNAVFEVGSR